MRKTLIEKSHTQFIGFMFSNSYKFDRVTIQVGLLSGIEFTINSKALRRKLSLWVGKVPKTKKQAIDFWLDIIPEKDIARTLNLKYFNMKMYFTKKQLKCFIGKLI